MSKWPLAPLGELMALDLNQVSVEADASYNIVGVLNRGRGLLHREPILGSSTSYMALNRIGPEQVVYSKLKAFEGAITVAPAGLGEAFASPEFPTFTCTTQLLPAYFRLLTGTPSHWAALQGLSTGMGGRRERVKPADFLTISIALPPVVVQRRIVDVMAAVDAQIDALEGEVQAAEDVLTLMRADHPDAPEVTLGSVLTGIESGKSVQTVGDSPRDGVARVLKLSAVRPGRFDASEAKRLDNVSGYSPAHLVAVGDLLVTRANTPQRVGYVTVAREVPQLTYMPDLIWRARCDRVRVMPEYLAHLLSAPEFRRRITATAGGTSVSMVKINKRGFAGVEIPLPSLAQQADYAQSCDSLLTSVDSLAAERARLRLFRSTLLTTLLNQEIEIPESYDSLLEVS